jgi:hypothetical protein
MVSEVSQRLLNFIEEIKRFAPENDCRDVITNGISILDLLISSAVEISSYKGELFTCFTKIGLLCTDVSQNQAVFLEVWKRFIPVVKLTHQQVTIDDLVHISSLLVQTCALIQQGLCDTAMIHHNSSSSSTTTLPPNPNEIQLVMFLNQRLCVILAYFFHILPSRLAEDCLRLLLNFHGLLEFLRNQPTQTADSYKPLLQRGVENILKAMSPRGAVSGNDSGSQSSDSGNMIVNDDGLNIFECFESCILDENNTTNTDSSCYFPSSRGFVLMGGSRVALDVMQQQIKNKR